MNATYLPDAHRYEYPEDQLSIELTRFSEDRREGLTCEITIRSALEPKAGLLHFGRLNLASTQSRERLASALTKRSAPGWHHETDFAAIIEQIAYRSVQQWRRGDPLINLYEAPRRERPRWLIEPFIEYAGPTIFFAWGGTGKSFVSLALALTAASGAPVFGNPSTTTPMNVLYLDWEADEDTHIERLDALSHGLDIQRKKDIHYKRLYQSLPEAADALRLEIATRQIGFMVLDSMGAARAGEPESAEATIKLFNAARSLGIPWVGVDHLAKSSKQEGGGDMPFGSVYTTNLARRTFRIEGEDEDGDPDKPLVSSKVLAVINKKANNGRLIPRRAFRLRFETDEHDTLTSATIDPVDYTDVPAFRKKLQWKTQIEMAMTEAGEPVTEDEIAAIIKTTGADITPDAVRTYLNRHGTDKSRERLFVKLLRQKDGKNLWYLYTPQAVTP